MTYAILLYPHANKRYFESVKTLSVNEFTIAARHFENKVSNLHYDNVGGMEVLLFDAETLTEKERKILHMLSANYALFELHEEKYLRPLMEEKYTYFKEDVSNILKYKGKTNESFTDLMVNVGVFSSDFGAEFDEPLSILDPMCGKGTTLLQGLIKGYHAAGVEITKSYYVEFESFMKKYFQFHRYKYEISNTSVSQNGKKKGAKVIFETADTAEHFKQKDRRILQFVNGDTADTSLFFGKEKFHVIAADLPYGVQHSSTSPGQFLKVEKLLDNALDGWNRTLKKGGTVVLAYNTYNVKREELEKVLTKHGLTVLNEEPYNQFEHWVEQAVNRDLIVAKK